MDKINGNAVSIDLVLTEAATQKDPQKLRID